jgi:hypothetical protein
MATKRALTNSIIMGEDDSIGFISLDNQAAERQDTDIFGYSFQEDNKFAASYDDNRNVNKTDPPRYNSSHTTISTEESSFTKSDDSLEKRHEHLRQQRARAVQTYYAQYDISDSHHNESHIIPEGQPSTMYQSKPPESLTRHFVINAIPPGRRHESFNTGRNHQSFNTGRNHQSFNPARKHQSFDTRRNHQSFDTGRHGAVANEDLDVTLFSLGSLDIGRHGALKSPAPFPFKPKKGGLKKPKNIGPSVIPQEIEVALQTEIPKEKSSRTLIQKNVSFTSVEIRFYNPCLGDNPAVSCGPSLSIDWDFDPSIVANMSINEYETKRPPRRRELAMVMTREAREEIVRNIGATKQEIAEHVRQMIKIKNQRRQTANNLPVSNVEEAVERARRKVGKVFFKTKKKKEVIEEPVEKKNVMYEQWKASMAGEDFQERKKALIASDNTSGGRDDVSDLGSHDGSYFYE